MHIPVIIGGMLLGWNYGLLIGLMTPLLSALLTGMPQLVPPFAVAMMAELGALGAFSGALYPLFKENALLTLMAAIIAGRTTWAIAGYFLLPLLGIRGVDILYPLSAGLILCLPGIIVQVILIPIILGALEKLKRREA
jgi:hypothetical protein